jgi:hypothetical protein
MPVAESCFYFFLIYAHLYVCSTVSELIVYYYDLTLISRDHVPIRLRYQFLDTFTTKSLQKKTPVCPHVTVTESRNGFSCLILLGFYKTWCTHFSFS